MHRKISLPTLIIILFLGGMSSSQAQFYPNTHRSESDWQVSVGLQGLVTPFSPRKPGFGGSVSLNYLVEPTITARAMLAINMVQDLNRNADFKYIPATIGLMAYLKPDVYVSGDAGLAYSSNILRNRINMWLFLSPGVGYSFRNNGLDLSLHYDLLHRNNEFVGVLGLKVSYAINLSKY